MSIEQFLIFVHVSVCRLPRLCLTIALAADWSAVHLVSSVKFRLLFDDAFFRKLVFYWCQFIAILILANLRETCLKYMLMKI